MMVSIFPDADSDAGLSTNNKIEIEAKAKVWADLDDFNAPSQPISA